MHAFRGLGLLREPENDVLENLTPTEKRKLRALVVEMVLGTDLGVHFEQLSQFLVKLADGVAHPTALTHLQPGLPTRPRSILPTAHPQVKLAEGLQLTGEGQDTHIFLANALHAADLGSTAKPSETYYRWMQAR